MLAEHLSPQTLHSLLLLALGFAFGATLVTGYQWLTAKPAGMHVIGAEGGLSRVLGAAFIVFAAPYLMLRSVVRGQRGFFAAMVATVAASGLSILSGHFVLSTLAVLRLWQLA